MLFYEVKGFITDEEWSEEKDDFRRHREECRNIAAKSTEYNRKLQKQGFFYISNISKDLVSMGIICRQPVFVEEHLQGYIDYIGINLKDMSLEETTFYSTRNMLRSSGQNGFILWADEILEEFELDRLDDRRFRIQLEFREFIADRTNRERIYRGARHFLASETFIPELDRIYAGEHKKRFFGHPVHYMIQTDDSDTRDEMSRLLIQALHANKRLQSRRFSFLEFMPGKVFSSSSYEALYKSSFGGAVVISCVEKDDDDMEDNYAFAGSDTIETLCKMMMKYRNEVLTIFCLTRECTKSKKIFFENLGGASFVELKEEFVSENRAVNFLRMLAANHEIDTDDALFSGLDKEEGYLAPDLHRIFDEWFNKKLKNGIYPQYKNIAAAKREVLKAAPKGSAYDELMEMIGLEEAKKVILQALNYYKAQKIFAEKGMKTDRPSMHMVFTGNPGTAKTTVARLFARIMKDNELLSQGKLVEVGRGDLVGKFVGWTAPAIQKKFREARGNVLFIDEAYSLVDDRDGSYGDEAINTIVQEMENHRDDVVVIFAGYPDKMECFIRKNPGLRSRIAYYVPFADYTTSELCNIAQLMSKQKGLTLNEKACSRLEEIFETAREERDFGNGRYVRNVLDKARMAQATRLLSMDIDEISTADVTTISADDIEEVPVIRNTKTRKIGFCVS